MSERLRVRFKTQIPIGDFYVSSLTFIDYEDDAQTDTGFVFNPKDSVDWDEWLSVDNDGPVADEIFVPMHNIEYAQLFLEEESSDCHVGED